MTKTPIIREPKDWWEDEPSPDHGGTHGASGVGTRAVRHQKKAKGRRPGWMITFMALGLVGVVLAGFLIYLDFRKGMTAGDPNYAVVTTKGRTMEKNLPSPDTIKRKLEKAGFEVEPLVDTYDRTKHGYDVSETSINGISATILAFKDKATSRDFAKVALHARYVIVRGDLWAISFGQTEDFSAKQLAEEIAIKGLGHAQWQPEGE